MRFWHYKAVALALLAVVISLSAVKANEIAVDVKNIPDKLGKFHARGPISTTGQEPVEQERLSFVYRNYLSPSGKTYRIEFSEAASPSAAYALLTNAKGSSEIKADSAGMISVTTGRSILFCKGSHFVGVFPYDGANPNEAEISELATAYAQHLDGESNFPVLVKHLPEWETVAPRAGYAITQRSIKKFLPDKSILDVVSFEGGAEAVVAQYDTGKLVIIEFNTPQIATTNDQSILVKLNELKTTVPPAGTPLPPAYRRVGNYAVFVFDAPSEQAASQLIDQVKYEQTVQWLGENPFSYEKATREFTETTLAVFVNVVKTSGLALVSCLAVGGFFGALLFRFRRAQQRARDAFADSDAMLRLNLDELTPESDPGRRPVYKNNAGC